MKHFLGLFCFSIYVLSSFAQDNKPLSRPKLVVGIVVDQMRWDYLYRYYDRYSATGFKRMMNQGFNCQNAFINYLPSFTGPGHACVYTGSVPSIHGIAANDWLDNATGKHWYCTEDTAVLPVGGSHKAGRMSPHNLLATTITDELRLASNMRSKVFGIAIKDRGSILPAGHLSNGSYWFDDSTGNFITSTFYTKQLPQWVVNFNNKRLADSFVNRNWELLYPLNTYTQSLQDNNSYEGPFPGERAPVFPHSVREYQKPGYGYYGLRYLPAGNIIVFNMANACIEAEQLGKDNHTDFLCLSFSSPDYAGHRFAPNSVEMEDMMLRFDLELGAFMKQLDRSVGEGNYTIFLTADHGAAHNPMYIQDINIPAGSESDTATARKLDVHLKTQFGTSELLRLYTNYQVYLNEHRITSAKLDRNKIKNSVINWFRSQPGVAYVADMEDMSNSNIPEPIRTMIVNGYHHKRSGSIQVIPESGWFSGDHGSTGTTHGSWNPYDTHIPLLWYGWGIPKGETYSTVHMTDISATLATLLHVQMPSGCVGKVITKIAQ